MSSYCVRHSGISGNPVDFPSLAFVCGKRLLEPAGNWCDFRNHEPDKDRDAIQSLMAMELPAAILELTDGRWRHDAIAGACEIEAPFAGIGVVEPEAQPFEMPALPISHELDQVGATAPHLGDSRYTFHFDPIGGAR